MALGIYVFASAVYLSVCFGVWGKEALRPTPDNHYAYLAWSWMQGQLHLPLPQPPGGNDWACFDTELRAACPADAWARPDPSGRHRWYVSFPPFPALLILPAVALLGPQVPDRVFWGLWSGLAPALLFLLLQSLSARGLSLRSRRDNLTLSGLFAFGTVYFFTAVFANGQGTVWFTGHVIASALLVIYTWASIAARSPWMAGSALMALVATRPTTALLGLLFVFETLRVSGVDDEALRPWHSLEALRRWLGSRRWKEVFKRAAAFTPPLLVGGLLLAIYNLRRFDDPLEFGHRYLQVAWTPRIERWGLFNYHYLARNLAVMWTSLPWLSSQPPRFLISGHGLALWLTTPNLLWTLWSSRLPKTLVFCWAALLPVALANLFYQNSGWLQFGYRFSLDYMVLLFVILALGGRRFGKGFWLCGLFALGLNTFGALTFDRGFYYFEPTQNVLFQPD